nr:MAG TPA: hypothetical protein [Caudoviricetes sp.]
MGIIRDASGRFCKKSCRFYRYTHMTSYKKH